MEDLQFQLLEQGVISGDQLENATESSEQQVTSLTSQLEEERERVRGLEKSAQTSEQKVTSLARQLDQEREKVKGLEIQLEVG